MSSSGLRAFASLVQRADRLIKKQSLLKQKGLVVQRDLNFVYEIAFLSCFVAFENYLEGRFIDLLVGKETSKVKDFMPRATIKSPAIARELVYSGRPYVEFLPYKNTIRLAERFFRGGRPFTDLPSDMQQELSFCHAIRNDLAHKSRSSRQGFVDMCIGRGVKLPSKDLIVHRYLQTSFSVGYSRFENHVSQLITIAQELDH
jgi:hypothetical protein